MISFTELPREFPIFPFSRALSPNASLLVPNSRLIVTFEKQGERREFYRVKQICYINSTYGRDVNISLYLFALAPNARCRFAYHAQRGD